LELTGDTFGTLEVQEFVVPGHTTCARTCTFCPWNMHGPRRNTRPACFWSQAVCFRGFRAQGKSDLQSVIDSDFTEFIPNT